MQPHCEMVVRELLPAIRSILAQQLIERGLTQKQVASRLNLSQPAVSHYLSKARAKETERIWRNIKIGALFDTAVEDIVAGKNAAEKFCTICREIRREGIMCKSCGLAECDKCLAKPGYV